MNPEFDTFDEILGLADAFLMDRATEQDVARLAELLENDETARRMYVDRIDETISLRKWSCSQINRPNSEAIKEALESDFSTDDMPVSLKDDPQPVDASLISRHDQRRHISRLASHIRTHPLKFSTVGVVATCVAWVVFFKVLFPPGPAPTLHRPGHEVASESGAATAVLRLAWNCKWRDGAEVIEQGSSLRTGQVIDIEEGTVEIVFDGGVKVLLEGRTRFVVRGPKVGHLEVGRLYAHVPRPVVGFEISTPSAAIRDLGTEFGLAVGSQGTTELHVTVGAVAIALGDLSNLSSSSRRVDAGEAVRVSTGQGIETIEDSTKVSAKFARLVMIAKQPETLLPEAERTPPADGLSLWLAADSHVDIDDRDFVNAWRDVRETAGEKMLLAKQPSSNLRPSLVADAISGKPAIRFGGAHMLELPTPETLGITGSDYELFIVAQTRSDEIQFLIGGAPTNFEMHINGEAGARFIPVAPFNPERASDLGQHGDFSNGQPYIFSARVDRGTDHHGIVRINGFDSKDLTPTDSRSASRQRLQLGARDGLRYPLSGDIAEILIYRRSLSNVERQRIEVYLGMKYRIVRQRSQIRPAGG